MAHIWAQTIPITKELAQHVIEKQHILKVTSIEDLGEGFDNVAYLINKEFVFRFPRREMGVECMENEIQILPYIASKVSFPFTYPRYVSKPSAEYQAPFAGYPLLVGTPLSETPAKIINNVTFAKILARWLKELHSVHVVPEHYTAIKGDQSWRLNFKQRIEISKNRMIQYENCYIEAGFSKEDLFDALDTFRDCDFSDSPKASYVHGDLYSRHILVNNIIEPVGLIDWGDIHIGHPALDLALPLSILSDDALKIFIDTYGEISQETKIIAHVRAFYHSIVLLPYCFKKKQENLKRWTILTIKQKLKTIPY